MSNDEDNCDCANCVHRRAIRDLLMGTLNDYLRNSSGVPAGVVQCALGALVTATFDHVSHDQREAMLEQFCSTLFESVEDLNDADVREGRVLS